MDTRASASRWPNGSTGYWLRTSCDPCLPTYEVLTDTDHMINTYKEVPHG